MAALSLSELKSSARGFVQALSTIPIPELYGITDGKAVGTYVELAFHKYLMEHFSYTPGSSAKGIDFPELEVDLKVTSIRQPQSSCPFRAASQKVYGLGYHLLIFVYEKSDDPSARTTHLDFQHAIFISRERTGDYQTTYGLNEILRRDGNRDDIIAFLEERNLPLDEIGREVLTDQILREPPLIGYLTVSNALQWRLQYSRVVSMTGASQVDGVEDLIA
jgi:hypothetical protein